MMKRTPILMAVAKQMRARGWKYSQIALALGIHHNTAHVWGDQVFAEKRRQQAWASRTHGGRRRKNCNVVMKNTVSAIDAARLMKAIPKDTRDLTASLCGDPVPGRRAIDRIYPPCTNKLIPASVDSAHNP